MRAWNHASLESLDFLTNHCENFAKRRLATSGEFFPFGAFVNAQGKVEALAVTDGQERPDPRRILELMHEVVQQLASDGRLRADAIATHVDIPAKVEPPLPDGIRMQVETPGLSLSSTRLTGACPGRACAGSSPCCPRRIRGADPGRHRLAGVPRRLTRNRYQPPIPSASPHATRTGGLDQPGGLREARGLATRASPWP